MKIFNDLVLKFEKSDWALNPEFGLIDEILEQRPDLYDIVKDVIIHPANFVIFVDTR